MSAQAQAIKGVEAVVDALGLKGVTPEQLELIAEAVVGLVDVLGGAMLKRAAAAGAAAAAQVTSVEQANEVLKAAAQAQESK